MCVWVNALPCVCMHECVHSFSAAFPQDKQCYPNLLWILWLNWHWLHVHKQNTHKTLPLNQRTDGHACVRVFGPRWLRLTSITPHAGRCGRKEGGASWQSQHLGSYCSSSKWNIWLGSLGWNNELQYLEKPTGKQTGCWQVTGGFQVWVFIIRIINFGSQGGRGCNSRTEIQSWVPTWAFWWSCLLQWCRDTPAFRSTQDSVCFSGFLCVVCLPAEEKRDRWKESHRKAKI